MILVYRSLAWLFARLADFLHMAGRGAHNHDDARHRGLLRHRDRRADSCGGTLFAWD